MRADDFRKYVAELLGTFMLVFFAAGSVMVTAALDDVPGPIFNGLCTGLILMVVVWALGPVSGAHVNPAFSIAFVYLDRLPARLLPGYVVAQMVGSGLAGLVLLWLFGDRANVGANLPNAALGISPGSAFVVEILLSFVMMIVILGAVLAGGRLSDFAAVPIGAVVGVEVMLMGPVTGAAMNPARAFGPYLAMGDWTHYWIYSLGPIVGVLIAARLFRWLGLGAARH